MMSKQSFLQTAVATALATQNMVYCATRFIRYSKADKVPSVQGGGHISVLPQF
jgi:hypothetical protein